MGNSGYWTRLSLDSATSVYLSHLSDLRLITLSISSWAEYPSAKLTSGMTLLFSQSRCWLSNTCFCKHKLSPNAPESTLSSHTTMPAPRVLVCKNHQRKLPEIYIQGFFPWIHGWQQSKSANSLQFGWAELVQWPLPVLCVSYAYLISSSSTTQMPRDS